MKPLDYYSKNPISYPQANQYVFYNVYKGETCLGSKLSEAEVYEIEAVNEVVKSTREINRKASLGGKFSIADVTNHAHDVGVFIIKWCDKAGLQAHREEYRNNDHRLFLEFKADLIEEHGLTGHSKAEKLFERVWDLRHADGYEAVASVFEDFVDLLQD